MPGTIIFSIFIVFAGAALCATAALFARQAMIVAYIVVGVAFGPAGLSWVTDAHWLQEMSGIGIMFLLYLLGLNMVPKQLLQMLREALTVTVLSAIAFAAFGAGVAYACGFRGADVLLIGVAMMFSSTIIGLKLLPTTALHHLHTGQVIISILLLQDLLAILVLIVLQILTTGEHTRGDILLQAVALPVLIGAALLLVRYVIEPLLARFDQIHEYLFLLVIAWCLSVAELAQALGLTHEIGAFVAGVALASCPVSMFIADSLRPLRDFFLILFFFSLGASFDAESLQRALWPALVLAVAMAVSKPWVFSYLLKRAGESDKLARETGARLGQISEFSLLIAILAAQSAFLTTRASDVVQLSAMLSFALSSYYIVMRYPTPIAVRESLRRD